MNKRAEILRTAENMVNGNRAQDYGSVEDNFNTIAMMWSAYTGHIFNAKDVAVMMALVKIARISSGHAKEDNRVDLAGYAACGGEIEANAERVFYETAHD